MTAHLNHMIARQRCVDLQRAGEQARLAREVPQRRRGLRDPHPVTPASTECWRGRPAPETEPTIRGAR